MEKRQYLEPKAKTSKPIMCHKGNGQKARDLSWERKKEFPFWNCEMQRDNHRGKKRTKKLDLSQTAESERRKCGTKLTRLLILNSLISLQGLNARMRCFMGAHYSILVSERVHFVSLKYWYFQTSSSSRVLIFSSSSTHFSKNE